MRVSKVVRFSLELRIVDKFSLLPSSLKRSFTVNTCTCMDLTHIDSLSVFTAPSNIPASAMTQKKAAAPAAAPDPPADEEEEGWFTFMITYKHRHI